MRCSASLLQATRLVAAVAELGSFGGVRRCMKVCPYCGRENDAILATCRECGTSLPDTEGAVAPVQPKPTVVCPACGAQDDYKTGVALRGSFSWLVFFLGGFIAVLFHNASRQRRVQCNACGEFFDIRTALSNTSLVLFWLLIAPTIIVLAYVLFVCFFSKVSMRDELPMRPNYAL